MNQWLLLVDPSSLAILSTALFMIYYGSRRSMPSVSEGDDGNVITSLSQHIQNSTILHSKVAIIMPIVGSIALILLFYFLKIMYYLLVAILALNGFFSVIFVVDPLVHEFLKCYISRFSQTRLSIFPCCCDPFPLSTVITIPIGIFLVILWLVTNNWVVINILCFCIGIMGLSVLRLPNMKVSVILLGLFFVYDVFWVFFSEYFFKQNVMITVATSVLDLPVLLKFPKLLHEWSAFSDIVLPYPLLEIIRRYQNLSQFGNFITWFILGMGDVILPGMFLSYLYRFDMQRSSFSFKKGYFKIGMISYAFGMFWTQVMLLLLRKGQPALLYLVPSVLVPVVCFGTRRKELRFLWTGLPSNNQNETINNDNLENVSLMERNNDSINRNSQDGNSLSSCSLNNDNF